MPKPPQITREAFDEALHTIFVSYLPADLDAAYKAKLKAGAYADQEAAKFDAVDTGFVATLERMGEMQAELDAMEARALLAECVGCCCHMDGFNDCATCKPKRARLAELEKSK
jgi:hypothetical protein